MVGLDDYKDTVIEKSFYKSDYQRVRNGKLEQVHDSRVKHEINLPAKLSLTIDSVTNILNKGSYGIISAGINSNSEEDGKLSEAELADRYKALEKDLVSTGHSFTKVKGVWNDGNGGVSEEVSYLVNGLDEASLTKLGTKYNQDSVIHGSKGTNRYIYTTGSNKGKYHSGKGFEELPKAKEGYTVVTLADGSKFKFSLNLDFDKLL